MSNTPAISTIRSPCVNFLKSIGSPSPRNKCP